MTRTCVPLMGQDCGEMVEWASAAQASGAEMVELRLDYLQSCDPLSLGDMMRRVRQFPGAIVATCRIAAEGGRYVGEESARMELLGAAARSGADYIDIEYAAWQASEEVRKCVVKWQRTGSPPTKIIFSKHDFEQTPPDLEAVFAELLASPADVVKLACNAKSITDSLRMIEAMRSVGGIKEVIALSMGETGILTRVLARKFGALLTFASLSSGRESAPGQPTLHDLRQLYRWDSVGPDTLVYGVIGCPVGHSMSPAIHNAAFAELGLDAVYLPMRVEPDYASFQGFMDECLAKPWLGLSGLSVTIPHKENLMRYVDARGGQIEPLSRRIGVANTLVIKSRPAADNLDLYAFNTDYRGALEAICTGLNCTLEDLDRVPVAVLGAGGVSRAIVAGLTDCGCSVTIYNRTVSRAVELADEFEATALPWEQPIAPGTQIVVNCTSIGMWPHVDASPLKHLPRDAKLAVFDTVYNPIETRLLRDARAAGHPTIDGVAMFVGQAAAQFERWTGKPAPMARMREVVVRRLNAPR